MSTTNHDPDRAHDLSALAWVHGELRRSLETAHKALRRYLREAEAAGGSDVDAVDPAVLRTARVQLHQGAGALELVGQPMAAHVLRASESAVQRLIAKPALADGAAVDAIEHVSFAVLDYLARLLAGKGVGVLQLFEQYAAVQAVAGAERIHPADLWAHDWRWRELPPDPSIAPHPANDVAREHMEALSLALMRRPDAANERTMSDLCAALGNGQRGEAATLWKLAAAFFQAQAARLLPLDVHAKRLAPRMLAQLRAQIRGDTAVSERLAQDLLFFCSRAADPPEVAAAPRLAAVRQVWPADAEARVDYAQSRLGRFDPALLTQARRRVGAAKDVWSAAAAGEAHRLPAIAEAFTLLGDSVQRLLPEGAALAHALQAAGASAADNGTAPAAPLAMEVATALLYVEAVLEDGELDTPGLDDRMARLSQRIEDATAGAEPQALEAWMEELYRRISDRQTMGSVVQELRGALSEVEKQVDGYFRDASRRELLLPVHGQLSLMRGVFSVLGLEQAAASVQHLRDRFDELTQVEVDADHARRSGMFERLADNLGSLSFLIDMLSVQPQLVKKLFRFDPDSGMLASAVVAAPERSSVFGALHAEPEAPAARAEVPATAAPPEVSPAAAPAPAATVPAPAPAPAQASGLEDDAEMREIFLEEAREVLAGGAEALQALREQPDDLPAMTTIRRAFHTLKGSSRMVGLREFGEAAWACEQLYNARLADQPRMDGDLSGFTGEAFAHLGAWVDAIAAGGDAGRVADPVVAAADALREHGQRRPIGTPATAPAADTLEAAVPDLPRAEELDLPAAERHEPDDASGLPPLQAPALPELETYDDTPTIVLSNEDLPATREPEPAPDAGLRFELDLAGLEPDGAAEPTSPGAPSAPALPAMPELPEPETLELSMDSFALEDAAAPGSETIGALPELGAELDALPDLSEPTVTEGAGSAIEEPVEVPAAEPPAEQPALDDAVRMAAADAPEPADDRTSSSALGELVPADEEPVKIVGPLRIAIPLFNIFLSEADEQSRRLGTEIAEWVLEPQRPVGESTIALAHSLAGNSGTVGFVDLSVLARALEHALARSRTVGHASAGEGELFGDAAEEIRRLLHQFAAGFLKPVAPELMARLAAHEQALADVRPEPEPVDEEADAVAESRPVALVPAAAVAAADDDEDLDAIDAVDGDLFPIFEEEAEELLPQLRARLHEWLRHPGDAQAPAACLRTLHTFKGGARLAGAMRIGERAHRLEGAIEQLTARGNVAAADVEHLLGRADALSAAFERLCAGGAEAAPPTEPSVPVASTPLVEPAPPAPVPAAPEEGATSESADAQRDEATSPAPEEAVAPEVAIDWSRFSTEALPVAEPIAADTGAGGAAATVRVRAPLLDRLVNEAGEISITRARIEADMGTLQGSLNDLTENLDRLRRQLRDIELQAETQIASRMEAAKASAQSFDPLEMDRFTRFQELTRMMAESVNDVATVQRGLQRTLQSTEDELAAQARLTRDLQDDLLRTRMVEFESLADRLYRVVRQAAKDTGKTVRLDLVGGAIEVDRGVLERMVGPFEHLLRNCVAHGIEAPAARRKAGKDAGGAITVTVTHEGNEVGVEVRDDGAGLDLKRIRARAVERGLIAADASLDEAALIELIYAHGFSTAEAVSELAGRGVGMDVVRAEVDAMGGRIETATEAGRGTRFRIVLPLTTLVTQVVMLRFGGQQVAVPSTLVEIVRRVPSAELEAAYAAGHYRHGDEDVPLYWLGALLDADEPPASGGRAHAVVVIRSAAQRVALHVSEVVGNQEVVVKYLGPQLSRLPGLAGITLLPSGAVALIYNPVALATVYGAQARERQRAAAAAREQPAQPQAPVAAAVEASQAPLVMVVDDSLTVRRITQRLLTREGYRVTLAKDGLEALERLADERPAVLLSDIEMPRMDGFDLVRNVRADGRLAGLPVIMITSRIAQKHRDYAAELGVDHYLGKPYAEDDLLALVARYARAAVAAG